MVVDVQPFAAVLRRGVQREALALERTGGEQRDDLFGELVRAVVVAAVGDRRLEAEGLDIAPHDMVGPRLGGVVGRPRAVGRLLAERLVAVEREVPVDLAGRDVVKPLDSDAPGGVAKRLGPEHVGPEEACRVQDGQAVVRLGREVHERLDAMLGEGRLDQSLVADVSVHENQAGRSSRARQGCGGPPRRSRRRARQADREGGASPSNGRSSIR